MAARGGGRVAVGDCAGEDVAFEGVGACAVGRRLPAVAEDSPLDMTRTCELQLRQR